MPSQNLRESRLKVAIIGAGPAGLGAAIEFNKLPFVDWTVYEKASAVREIGAGLSIQSNTWRLLESMGAAKNLKPKDFFRPADNHSVQHRYVYRNQESFSGTH
jgi:salicylate hydroxylase